MSTKRTGQLRVGKGHVLAGVVVACVLAISSGQADTSGGPGCEGVQGKVRGGRLVVDTAVLRAVNSSLQTALNCVPEGGVVEFNLSTLPFNNALEINKSVTIEGGRAVVQCPDAATKPVFRIRSNEVKILRLNFERCNRYSLVGLIDVKDSKNVTLEDLRFFENENVGGPGCISAVQSEIQFWNIDARNNKGMFGGVLSAETDSIAMIRGCEFHSNKGLQGGGGINLADSDLEIFDSTFNRNEADFGGAIFVQNNDSILQDPQTISTIQNATFQSNGARRSGGAIYVEGGASLTIQDSLFYRSHSMDAGGAIGVNRTLRVEIARTNFTDNDTFDVGGAISANGDDLPRSEGTLSHCTFYKNLAVSGGALHTQKFVNFTVDGGRFIENSARFGGAFSYWLSRVEIFDILFEGNEALFDGGAIFSEESTQRLIDVDFKRNTAEKGGALLLKKSARIYTERCHFEGNVAELDGGGIAANEGRVIINSTTFRFNEAKVGGAVARRITGRGARTHITNSILEGNIAHQGGGAVYCEHMSVLFLIRITIDSSTFSRNTAGEAREEKGQMKVTSSDGTGGAVMILEGLNGEISDCTFSKNSAGNGGAVYARSIHSFTVATCNFSEGSAHRGGALLALNPGTEFDAIDVNFVKNSARWGGAISYEGGSSEGSLQVERANFKENVAVEGGGAIDVLGEGRLRCEGCRFDSNEAGNDKTGVGGAINAQSASNLTLRNSTVFNCTATQSGGGIFFQDSTFAAENVIVKSNLAGKAGGGFAMEFGEAPSGWGCTSCDFDGNKAAKGGGMHVAVTDSMRCQGSGAAKGDVFELVLDCEETLLENTKDEPMQTKPQVVLNQSTFGENTGLGSDIFLEDRGIDVCCDGKCWNTGSAVDEALESCSFTDSADKGLAIGSPAQSVQVTPPKIMDHASDKELPVMTITMFDSFGRITKENATLKMQVTPAGAELFGSPVASDGVLMSGQLNVTGVVMRALPTVYDLGFEVIFNDRDTVFSVSSSVKIRECVIGEITKGDGLRCDRCPGDFFSFNVSDETCRPCPVREAKCSGGMLAPLDGFWHSGPRSQKLHSCLSEEACTYANRTNTLFASANKQSSASGLQSVQNDYPQCAEGYKDVLCGSCKASYGKRGFECGKCWGKLLTGVGVVLVMFVLAGVSLIYVRSAAKHAEEAMAGNLDDPAQAHPTVPQKRSRPSDSFKILVNFFQITGSAAAINVDWTASMLGILSFWDLVSGGADTGSFFAFECLFSSHKSGVPRSIKSSILLAVLPFMVWAVFVAVYACVAFKRRKSLKDLQLWSGIAFRAVLQASYISMTRTFLRLLYCVDVSPLKGSFWVQDTSVSCYNGHHLLLVLFVGAPGLLFVSIGFPCWLTFRLMWRRKSLGKGKINVRYGFLYKAYKESTPAWEVVILVRKALFSSIVVFGRPLGGGVQTCLALFVMMISIILQMHFEPFLESKLNTMELVSLTVSTLAFIIGNLVSQPEVTGEGRMGLTVVFFGVVGVYIVFMFKRTFDMGFSELRGWVERKTLESQLGISNLGLLKKVAEIFHQKYSKD